MRDNSDRFGRLSLNCINYSSHGPGFKSASEQIKRLSYPWKIARCLFVRRYCYSLFIYSKAQRIMLLSAICQLKAETTAYAHLPLPCLVWHFANGNASKSHAPGESKMVHRNCALHISHRINGRSLPCIRFCPSNR
jgi:hypothetical protein